MRRKPVWFCARANERAFSLFLSRSRSKLFPVPPSSTHFTRCRFKVPLSDYFAMWNKLELGSTWNTKKGKRRKREGKMFFFFIYDDGDVERERKGLSSLVKKALFPPCARLSRHTRRVGHTLKKFEERFSALSKPLLRDMGKSGVRGMFFGFWGLFAQHVSPFFCFIFGRELNMGLCHSG